MENPSGKKKPKSPPSAPGQTGGLSWHPVIKKLIDACGGIPDAVELQGYLGPSDLNGYIRLYVSLNFKCYYEIPETGAVLYCGPYDESDEAQPTTLVVRASSELKYVQSQVVERTGPASFLVGNIQSAYPVGKSDTGSSPPAVGLVCLPIPHTAPG
jgi:hypothetical protein